LAVYTRDDKVDPVGACVGLRGQRVKNIVRELNNEKVDIIRWDSNPKVFINNSLQPAKLKSFEVDEENKRVRIIVSEDQLSLAIGKRGQNARLTSKLTGWQVDIVAEQVATIGFEEKMALAVQALAEIPGITTEQADVLVHQGLTSLEDLLEAEASDLAEIAEIGDQAGKIMESARTEAARRTLKIGETSAAPQVT
jgi:N utilization substance protein A